eukprot:5431327-Lingulodinium_polyedra.AAC.1
MRCMAEGASMASWRSSAMESGQCCGANRRAHAWVAARRGSQPASGSSAKATSSAGAWAWRRP